MKSSISLMEYREYKITKIFLPVTPQDIGLLKWYIHISSHRGVIYYPLNTLDHNHWI